MNKLDIDEVSEYVNKNITGFHENKLKSLAQLKLNKLITKKNPYLFRAKNITLASELINLFMDALLSSSEEKIFGDFLEELAIFVSEKTYNGWKSASTGIDLEFINQKENIRYIISIKSGPNWGNKSQQDKQEEDFKKAIQVIKQSKQHKNPQSVLGICYGKTRTTYLRNYMKVTGQNFWYFISGNKNLYKDIIKPLGYKAKERNKEFNNKKDQLINVFTQELLSSFCNNGIIDWEKLVEYNSGNLIE